MRYTYEKPLNSDGKWKVKTASLNYVKQKPAELIGDVRLKSKRKTQDYLDFEVKSLRIEPALKKVGVFTKVVGYLPCRDEQESEIGYVRILKPAIARIVTLIMALSMICCGAFGYWYYTTRQGIQEQQEQKILVYDAPESLKNPDSSKILVPAYDALYIDAKTQKFQNPLINVSGNKCLMKYTIINKNTGEIIFSTDKLLEPGKAFYDFKPNKAMVIGTYPVYIKVESYNLNNPKKQLNSSSIESEVIVQ